MRQTIRASILGCLVLAFVTARVPAQEANSAFPVRYVPKHALLAVGLRPVQLLAVEDVQKLKALFRNARLLNTLYGIPLERVERLMVSLSITDPTTGRFQTAFVLQTKEPIDQETVIETAMPQNRDFRYGGQRYRQDTDSQFRAVSAWFPDANTLIISEGDRAMEAVIDAAAMKEALPWQEHVQPNASAFVYENAARAEELIEMGMGVLRQLSKNRRHFNQPMTMPSNLTLVMIEPFLGMFAPLWQDVDTLIWNVSVNDAIELEVIANVEENGSVDDVEETLRAVRVLKRNAFGYLTKHEQPSDDAFSTAYSSFLQMSDDMLKTTKMTRDDRTIRITASLSRKKFEQTIATWIPTAIEARDQQRRLQCKSSLKQLAIAMHNYHDVHGQFPPPVIIGPDGETPVSWRVAILPFIEANEVHQQYHFDEPWDSEHNKQLLDQMPSMFRHPEDEADSTNTSYFAIVGEKTAFGPKDGDGVRMRDIIDGTSNTFMMVEAKKQIPWTKPDDIAYDPKAEKLPTFGGWYDDGYHAMFCDGAVQFIAKMLDDETLRRLIERNDGQVVNFRR